MSAPLKAFSKEHLKQADSLLKVCETQFQALHDFIELPQDRSDLLQTKNPLFTAIREILLCLERQDLDLKKLLNVGHPHCHVYQKTCMVVYLSLLTALQVKPQIEQELERPLDDHVLRELGLAAVFHDASMTREKYTNIIIKKGRLTEKDRSLVEQHPHDSLRLMEHRNLLTPLSGAAIQDHHRNTDGTGYPIIYAPGGKISQQVNILGRILKTADSYIAATSNRLYRDAHLPVEILFEMKMTSDQYYDKFSNVSDYLKYLNALELSESTEDRLLHAAILSDLQAAKSALDKGQISNTGYKRRITKTIPQAYKAEISIISRLFEDRILNDRAILKAMTRIIPPFELGCELTLSTGEKGTVTGFHPSAPCQPSLLIHTNAKDEAIEKHLQKNKSLAIQGRGRNTRVLMQGEVEVKSFLY